MSAIPAGHYQSQSRNTGLGAFLGKAYTDVDDKRQTIHELLRENNLQPAETLFIGDMEHDIAAAKHGGVLSCAVLTGYNTPGQLRAAGPDLIVEHLGELRRVLEKFNYHLQPQPQQPATIEMPVATVGALIFNSLDEVLLVRAQKWSNKWGIPGGKTQWGETSETALKVARIEFVLVQDCIHSKEFYKDAHFVLLNYTCRCPAKNPKVVLNDEGREYRWLPLAAAQKMNLNRPTKVLLGAVIKLRQARKAGRAAGAPKPR